MRVLGIETTSRRASVAIVESGRILAHAAHEGPSTHAEHTLPLVISLMDETGFGPRALDRIAVGTGPGSFTGLRVGIALAKGIALGAGIPLFGVGSLRAMAHAVAEPTSGLRCSLLDARREEIFAAVYSETGNELLAPCALARGSAISAIHALCAGTKVFLGEVGQHLVDPSQALRSSRTDLPDARDVALIAEDQPVDTGGAEPAYVREADAVVPSLPRSPFFED